MKKILSLLAAVLLCTAGFAQAAQPDTQAAALVGQKVTIAVTFTGGTPPVTFQWWKDGTAIAGATNASLVIASAAIGDSGKYAVHVVNPAGFTDSNNAILTVTPVPTLPVLNPLTVTKG